MQQGGSTEKPLRDDTETRSVVHFDEAAADMWARLNIAYIWQIKDKICPVHTKISQISQMPLFDVVPTLTGVHEALRK